MSRFWQVVYSLIPTIRAFFATVVDRVLMAMKKPAAKVVLAVVAALFVIAFLTQGAMAFTEHKDGSVTFTASEMNELRSMHQFMVNALEFQHQEIQRLEGQLKAEKDKRCL